MQQENDPGWRSGDAGENQEEINKYVAKLNKL